MLAVNFIFLSFRRLLNILILQWEPWFYRSEDVWKHVDVNILQYVIGQHGKHANDTSASQLESDTHLIIASFPVMIYVTSDNK